MHSCRNVTHKTDQEELESIANNPNSERFKGPEEERRTCSILKISFDYSHFSRISNVCVMVYDFFFLFESLHCVSKVI